MIEDKQVVINNFTLALRQKAASIFIGAGLSAEIFNNRKWAELVQPYADKTNLVNEQDFPFIAQAYVNSGNSLIEFKKEIGLSFISEKTTLVHLICAKLPIKNFWTTNYDCAIENALSQNNREYDLIYDNNSFVPKSNRTAVVYKCHGDCNNPESIVITTDDYESYSKSNPNFIAALLNELASNTILFLGYSFSDPDINNLLAKIKNENKNLTPHFFITKKETDKNTAIKQTLRLQQFEKYGIMSFLIDEYTEIEVIIKEIYKQYMSYSVLISGSASDYSYFGTEEQAKELIYGIGYTLVKSDLDHGIKIVNGEGLGIGTPLKEGIADAVTELGKDIADFWLPYPFSPKYYSQYEKQEPLETQYREYRKKMIDQCGIVFFIFGNKKNADGNIINADGVKKEFDIAVEKGKYVFPIGSTGYMAKELADLVVKDFEKYNGELPNIKAKYLEICEQNVSNRKILDNIFYIIDALAFRSDAR